MRTLSELQKLVAEWSIDNFGEQVSKTATVSSPLVTEPVGTFKFSQVQTYQVLGSLAPLLGIGEEIGELGAAKDFDQIKDAYGDIVIYLCDFASRDGVVLDEEKLKPAQIWREDRGPGVWYGSLLHAVLKRHQGIRGFDDYDFYCEKRDEAINGLLWQLAYNCGVAFGENSLLKFANETFDKIVAKRNWKSKNGHSREPLSIDEVADPPLRNKYDGKPPHAAAGWHPDQNGHG